MPNERTLAFLELLTEPKKCIFQKVVIFVYPRDDSQHCNRIFVDLEKSKVVGVPKNKSSKDHTKTYNSEFPGCGFFSDVSPGINQVDNFLGLAFEMYILQHFLYLNYLH